MTAAEAAAAGDPACTGLGDFYWEIGDADSAAGDGSIGSESTLHSSRAGLVLP